MPRLRSILMDNTLGRIFTNVTKSTLATPSNLIAGTVQSAKVLTSNSVSTTLVNTINVGSRTTAFVLSGGLCQVVSIEAKVFKSFRGVGINLDFIVKVGASYSTAVQVATLSLPQLTTSVTNTSQPFNVPAGQGIFMDLQYSGVPSTRAVGMSVTFNYFAGAV